jgi:3-phenylpropionate/trans-cinnamate dioxygenase ferredoxin reductase component
MPGTVLIAGGGHGGFQSAAALRQEGFDGRIVIVDPEGELPYQRPPLSKGYLTGAITRDALAFRPAAFFTKHQVELIADSVGEIDPGARTVRLGSGGALAYDQLILALGARAKAFPIEGADLDGVFILRKLADAERLRQHIESAEKLVVIGAGFIGLEVAASASKLGVQVTVVEIADRVMARAVLPYISRFFGEQHIRNGTRILLGASVERLVGHRGTVAAIVLKDGRRLNADLVLVATGVEANTEVAAAAGLRVNNGVQVKRDLQTTDPDISAIGDCAAFPFARSGDIVRLESVQNAVDQARCVAARIAGRPQTYDTVPWFWSDQGDLSLQMAGLNRGVDRTVVIGSPEAKSFSVLGFSNGRLVAVESVNRPSDHTAARKLLALQTNLTIEDAERPGFDLKSYLLQHSA